MPLKLAPASRESLRFDAANHAYYLNGARLPNVTGVLSGINLTPAYPPGPYKLRGKLVHQGTVYVDEGTIDHYDLSDAERVLGEPISGYIDSYRWLKTDFDFEWKYVEYASYDAALLVAGTPDRVGINRKTGRWVVLDFKTGYTGDETRLQLAAYSLMYFPPDYGSYDPFAPHAEIERYKVYLDKNGGKPKIELFHGSEYACDFAGWHGAVSFYKWKQTRRMERRVA